MFGTGGDHVDASSQAGHDDAKGAGCDPGGFGACALACRALRHHRADRLQVAQPGQRRGWQPHAAPASDDADAVAGSRCRKPLQWRFARRCRSGRMIFRPWCGSSPIRMPGAPGWTAACVGMAWGTCATSGPGGTEAGAQRLQDPWARLPPHRCEIKLSDIYVILFVMTYPVPFRRHVLSVREKEGRGPGETAERLLGWNCLDQALGQAD